MAVQLKNFDKGIWLAIRGQSEILSQVQFPGIRYHLTPHCYLTNYSVGLSMICWLTMSLLWWVIPQLPRAVTAMSDSMDPCSLSRTCPVLVVAGLAPIVWDNPPDPLAILAKSRLSALPSPEFWFRFGWRAWRTLLRVRASSIPLSSVSGRVLSRSIVGFGGWGVGGDIAPKAPKTKTFRLWSFVIRLSSFCPDLWGSEVTKCRLSVTNLRRWPQIWWIWGQNITFLSLIL